MNANTLKLLGGLLAAVLLFSLLSNGSESQAVASGTSYSEFLAQVREGNVSSVRIDGQKIRGVDQNGKPFITYAPNDPGLIGELLEHDVSISSVPPTKPSVLGQLLVSLLPIALLIGAWIYLMRRMQGGGARGGGGLFAFGKSRARKLGENEVKVTLADVAGVDEARDEVGEIVAFLKDPARFQQLGGSIPRGVLMVGSPGTGKTLLARAIAGEAKVPFFSISGSDFVEMFVGVGASRVRDLFKQAKEQAPCIVFIDEIDAVGRRRGAGLGGGHDEREQTLNQLLVEMDGFEGNEGIIVIAATNRPDVLDPALLRPGRFDRQVVVPLPDVTGREHILKLHMRKVPLGPDADARVVARGTPGFSGADLANLVNEAALFAARANKRVVSMMDFERAKDKIMMGAERRSMVMSEADKRLTAYHEAGHTIVGRLMPEHDPVHKVSIIPRGRALGLTLFLPESDRYSASKRQLESQLASLFGGRVAEELIFGQEAVTTGAQNDIERATTIARDMVTKWGFSESLGPLFYDEPGGEVFLGQGIAQRKHVSDETARRIDEEVRGTIERSYQGARALLSSNLDKLHMMAHALVQYETLTSQQIDDIMAGHKPRPPADSDGGLPRGPEDGTADATDQGSGSVNKPLVGPAAGAA